MDTKQISFQSTTRSRAIRVLMLLSIHGCLSSCFENPTPARLTSELSLRTSTSVTVYTTVSSDVESAIVEKGVCVGYAPHPTLQNASRFSKGGGTGDFEMVVDGLGTGTTYYLRAFAVNGAGISYGNELSVSLVGVTIQYLSQITGFGASLQTNVTAAEPIEARGICWSTSPDPTVNDAKTSDGTASGVLASKITGLTPGTLYYVRAYASTADGVTYSDPAIFTTLNYAQLTTREFVNAGSFVVSSGGNIASNGGALVTLTGICWSTHPSPTRTDAFTIDYLNYSTFSSTLRNLLPNTTYYVRAYAVNSVGTSYGNERTFTTPSAAVVDADGHPYSSVTIGTQVWLTENLRTARYANGEFIPYLSDQNAWVSTSEGAWSYYVNDVTYDQPYGKLYNWATVSDPRNVCPTGWHVPSDTEWTTMIAFLGGSSLAGGKMKEISSFHWVDPNTGASNSSGFTALPGASIPDNSGYSHALSVNGLYWTADPADSETAYSYSLWAYDASVSKGSHSKKYGFSIRCIRN